jgi:hypothetical protein
MVQSGITTNYYKNENNRLIRTQPHGTYQDWPLLRCMSWHITTHAVGSPNHYARVVERGHESLSWADSVEKLDNLGA